MNDVSNYDVIFCQYDVKIYTKSNFRAKFSTEMTKNAKDTKIETKMISIDVSLVCW